MLGIVVLIAMFGIYVGANLWASPRGSRRSRKWIEDCELETGDGAADLSDDLAGASARPACEELADHAHHALDVGGHDHDHGQVFEAIGHLFDHL